MLPQRVYVSQRAMYLIFIFTGISRRDFANEHRRDTQRCDSLNPIMWRCSLEPIFIFMELQVFHIVFPYHEYTHSVVPFAWISPSKEKWQGKSRMSGLKEYMGWDLKVALVFRGCEVERRLILTSFTVRWMALSCGTESYSGHIEDFVVADMRFRYQDISVCRSQQSDTKMCLLLCLLPNAFHAISSFLKGRKLCILCVVD